jgi:hypothetical protein
MIGRRFFGFIIGRSCSTEAQTHRMHGERVSAICRQVRLCAAVALFSLTLGPTYHARHHAPTQVQQFDGHTNPERSLCDSSASSVRTCKRKPHAMQQHAIAQASVHYSKLHVSG